MLAYLIERRLSCGEWQVVGWFASFQPAMRSACSLEPARLRVVDLEASDRGAWHKAPTRLAQHLK